MTPKPFPGASHQIWDKQKSQIITLSYFFKFCFYWEIFVFVGLLLIARMSRSMNNKKKIILIASVGKSTQNFTQLKISTVLKKNNS